MKHKQNNGQLILRLLGLLGLYFFTIHLEMQDLYYYYYYYYYHCYRASMFLSSLLPEELKYLHKALQILNQRSLNGDGP